MLEYFSSLLLQLTKYFLCDLFCYYYSSGMTFTIFNAAGALKLPTVPQSSPFSFPLIFDTERAVLSIECIYACYGNKIIVKLIIGYIISLSEIVHVLYAH